MSVRLSATSVVGTTPDDVFRTLTDVALLPDWNAAISAVVEQPDRLDVGEQWVVVMHALGRTWRSRSVVESIDPLGRVFAYRSVTDDDNPSCALWTWVVVDHADGALVTVACELHPQTFWRRVLFVRIRSRQLARTELTRSLAALAIATATATRHRRCAVPGTNNGGE